MCSRSRISVKEHLFLPITDFGLHFSGLPWEYPVFFFRLKERTGSFLLGGFQLLWLFCPNSCWWCHLDFTRVVGNGVLIFSQNVRWSFPLVHCSFPDVCLKKRNKSAFFVLQQWNIWESTMKQWNEHQFFQLLHCFFPHSNHTNCIQSFQILLVTPRLASGRLPRGWGTTGWARRAMEARPWGRWGLGFSIWEIWEL